MEYLVFYFRKVPLSTGKALLQDFPHFHFIFPDVQTSYQGVP